MKCWFDKLLKVVAVISAFMVIWRFVYPVYSWHQKLTVTVETPQGPVTASSVVAVEWSRSPAVLPDMPGAHHRFWGEATVVRLPGERYLFALVSGADFRALNVFAPDKLPKANPAAIAAFLPAAQRVYWSSGETLTLSKDQYPLLVTFDDVKNPASVKKVDSEGLDAVFGPGYSLTSVTMTITDEAVTDDQLEKVLGWWQAYRNKQLDGARYSKLYVESRFANSINRLAFKREK